MSESQVFEFDSQDPQMESAIQQARYTFRYFWRELSWEYRRIIPALELAAVKYAFTDPGGSPAGLPSAEQMWVNDVVFDGEFVHGVLINAPNHLTSVSQGDEVHLPVGGITDWMYSCGRVYGAYTVNLIRARMSPGERQQHDDAWGLDFGDPNVIELVPADRPDGPDGEHPMSLHAEKLVEFLNQDPMNVHTKDDGGWTFLHHQALAGSATCVSTLLQHGADPQVLTPRGHTALQLANSLGWSRVAQILQAAGG